MVATLHGTTARLAKVQGSLFDRREERQAAAQRAVMIEALHECDERLRRLHELEHVRAGAIELAAGIAV